MCKSLATFYVIWFMFFFFFSKSINEEVKRLLIVLICVHCKAETFGVVLRLCFWDKESMEKKYFCSKIMKFYSCFARGGEDGALCIV